MDQNEDKSLISVIVPVYNEEESINKFYECITAVAAQLSLPMELLFVNDGSTDKTLEVLTQLQEQDDRIKVINLSRNFGKEIALSAGIDYAAGDVAIPIDVDLQDPPELIPDMIRKWQEGYDVVYATRLQREGESWIKKLTAMLFYKTISQLTHTKIPKNTGDFRLMDRKVLEGLKAMREQHRFMKGLFTWVGFKQASIPYVRKPRYAGRTKWNYWRLWNFAIEGITSFTFLPLQIATYTGLIISFCSFIYGIYILVITLTNSNPVPGYPSLIILILFLGGVQLLTLGIIGEYVGRIYNEVKRRPLYLVQDAIGFKQHSHKMKV